MGVLTGIKNIQSAIDDSDTGKIRYLKLKDKETVTLWFLDDLDEGTPATDAGAGVAALIPQHTAGKNFRVRAQCTRDEGKCYACDQAFSNPRTNWGVTKRLYTNVLVSNGIDDPYVAVWNIATARSTVWETLLEEFIDEGTIAATPWRVRRSGEGTDTTYTIKKLPGEPADFSNHEDFDLNEIIKYVPYAEQEAYYTAGDESTQESESDAWL